MNTASKTLRRAARPALTGLTPGLLALALALAARPAEADRLGWDRSADGSLVDVQALVQGHPAPLYVRGGACDRFYFQAFKGRTYALRIHNTTGERVGVLIAVDGLNAVNGERSSLGPGEPMYVLGPWETAVIRGWRTSLDEVRQFVFVDEERSYAERTGQANGDLGWIRVLSFREQRPLAWNEPWWNARRTEGRMDDRSKERAEAPAPAPLEKDELQKAAPESRAQGGLARDGRESFPGTGWGDRRNDPARRVEFNPEPQATDHLVLRYEYESGLRALGIFPERRYRLWDREDGRLGFAQPPRW